MLPSRRSSDWLARRDTALITSALTSPPVVRLVRAAMLTALGVGPVGSAPRTWSPREIIESASSSCSLDSGPAPHSLLQTACAALERRGGPAG